MPIIRYWLSNYLSNVYIHIFYFSPNIAGQVHRNGRSVIRYHTPVNRTGFWAKFRSTQDSFEPPEVQNCHRILYYYHYPLCLITITRLLIIRKIVQTFQFRPRFLNVCYMIYWRVYTPIGTLRTIDENSHNSVKSTPSPSLTPRRVKVVDIVFTYYTSSFPRGYYIFPTFIARRILDTANISIHRSLLIKHSYATTPSSYSVRYTAQKPADLRRSNTRKK